MSALSASQHIQDSEMVRLRCNQYRLAALKAKRSGHTDTALQHMRVVKVMPSNYIYIYRQIWSTF